MKRITDLEKGIQAIDERQIAGSPVKVEKFTAITGFKNVPSQTLDEISLLVIDILMDDPHFIDLTKNIKKINITITD